MKCAVIFFHKDIDKIYQPEWIENCVKSIKLQKHQDFDCFELDYSGKHKKYCSSVGKKHYFFSIKKNNHIEAMNYLIDMVFALGYDVVFNTNMDDEYCIYRFEKQLKAIEEGYQLVSSNFNYINERGTHIKHMNMLKHGNIEFNLNKRHNVIAHPVVAIHKTFWTLKYNDLIGYEDLDLWQRAIKEGKKFIILPDYLLYYRIHNKQITKTHKLK